MSKLQCSINSCPQKIYIKNIFGKFIFFFLFLNFNFRLKRMTTRALDTAKLKNENDMLYKTIESLKEQIKEKDDKLKK